VPQSSNLDSIVPFWVKLLNVNRLRTSVVLASVLLWALTPTVACLLPGFSPTPAEMECCQKMAQHCGSSEMPASHACCTPSHQQETVVIHGQVSLLLKHAVGALAPSLDAPVPDLSSVSARLLLPGESPPIPLFPSSVAVLRI
jgi:hypothetical protein